MFHDESGVDQFHDASCVDQFYDASCVDQFYDASGVDQLCRLVLGVDQFCGECGVNKFWCRLVL